jgi:hypothetical protein
MANTQLAAGKAYEGMQAYGAGHSDDAGATWDIVDISGIGDHGVFSVATMIDFRIYSTGNAKIWVPMDIPGAIQLTLQNTISDSDVRSLIIADYEGHLRLPDAGFVTIGNECIKYSSKIGTNELDITSAGRGTRGTTAALHSAGAAIYYVHKDVRLVYNQQATDTLTKPGTEPTGAAPVIDGATSTNTSFKWIGPFISIGQETRPMGWDPEFDDTLPLADFVSLNYDSALDMDDIRVKDALAANTYIKRNSLVQDLPTGIKAAASAITLDALTIPASLQLEHLLTNERGEESLLATYRSVDSGTGKTLTPGDQAYRYRLRFVNGTICGCETSDADQWEIGSGSEPDYFGMSFVLDEPSVITAIALRMKYQAGRTFTATMRILGFGDNGWPDATVVLGQSSSFTQADIATSYVTVVRSFTNPVRLDQGRYWAGGHISTTNGTAEIHVSSADAAYARGDLYAGDATIIPDPPADLWFRLYGTPSQADAPVGSANSLTIDNIILALDNATPARTPLVLLEAAAVDVYLLDATLENTTTGQSIDLNAIMQTTETLDIDFDARTVTHSATDLAGSSYPIAITAMDEDDPFRLDPGANTLKWTEVGVVSTSIRTRYRKPYL